MTPDRWRLISRYCSVCLRRRRQSANLWTTDRTGAWVCWDCQKNRATNAASDEFGDSRG